VGGLVEEALNLTQGNLIQYAQGKETHAGAEAIRFIKGNTPGANLWYAKAALDHLIWNQAAEYLSPGYLSSMRSRARREFGQDFYWAPDSAVPRRAGPTSLASWGSEMLNADTLKKLEQRQQELADIFIDETDATKWPTPRTGRRGDRFWFKRNAGATATLIVKIQSMLDMRSSSRRWATRRTRCQVTSRGGQRRGARRERDGGGARIIAKSRGGRFGKREPKK
jgi:hypothetical protein